MEQESTTQRIDALLRAFLAGNLDGWDHLQGHVLERLRAIVRRRRRGVSSGFGQDETDDVVNDSYLRMHLKAEKLREFLLRYPAPYVRRYFKWCSLQISDLLRERGRWAERRCVTDLGDPQRVLMPDKYAPTSDARFKEMIDAAEELPELTREIFELRYLNEQTIPAIAEMLVISESSVKRELARAKLLLARFREW